MSIIFVSIYDKLYFYGQILQSKKFLEINSRDEGRRIKEDLLSIYYYWINKYKEVLYESTQENYPQNFPNY
ncbi:MAG TPA: hypothetical protein VHT73_08075, partial [Thermodesulfobacteriota bacterium]|nr:hypothetical protein [Thermodesulfobacteriota bacterium]